MGEAQGLTPLLSAEEVQGRVQALAEAIAPAIDDEWVAVCVLIGGLWFAADLTRALAALGRSPLFEALWLSSYQDGRTSLGRIEVLQAPRRPLTGRRVLLIDDVIDSGLSLAETARAMAAAGAAEVRFAVFARKPWPAPREVEPEFVAWEAPDRFLVGYGMDDAGRGRGLAGVWAAD